MKLLITGLIMLILPGCLNTFSQEANVETYDSVIYEYVYDTIYEVEYDTLYSEPEVETLPAESELIVTQEVNTQYFSLGGGASLFKALNNYTSDVNVDNSIRSNESSFSLKLFSQYHYNNWRLQSGIEMLCYKESISKEPTNMVIAEQPYNKTDTISSYYVEGPEGRTWHYITRENTYYYNDTSFVDKPYLNKTFLLNIPIMVGYSFLFNNLALIANAGVIPGFCLNTGSENIHAKVENQLTYTSQNNYRKFQFAIIADFGMQLPVHEKIIMKPGVIFRYQVLSLYKNEFLYAYKPVSLGFNCNFFYRF